jgi:hypothetical protein
MRYTQARKQQGKKHSDGNISLSLFDPVVPKNADNSFPLRYSALYCNCTCIDEANDDFARVTAQKVPVPQLATYVRMHAQNTCVRRLRARDGSMESQKFPKSNRN